MLIKIKNIRSSIAGRLMLLTSSMIIITAIIIAFFVIRKEINESYEDLLDYGKSVSSMMAQNCEYFIYTDDRKSLELIVNSIENESRIVYASIYNWGQRVVASTVKDKSLEIPSLPDIDDSQDSYKIFHLDFLDKATGKKYVNMLTPILSLNTRYRTSFLSSEKHDVKPRLVGYIQLGLQQESLRKKVSQFLLSTLGFTILFVIVGIALTTVITGKIISPIKKLNEASQYIAEGKFNQHIVIESTDEISQLARSFNHMLERLRMYRYDVESHTVELHDTNKQLRQEVEMRTRTEASLARTKGRLQHLLVSTPAVIYSCKTDRSHSVTFISDNIESLTGYKPVQFLDNHEFWEECIHPDDRVRVAAEISSVFESGNHKMQYRLKHVSGKYVWVLDEVRLMYDDEGKPMEFIGYLIDITERKKLEDKLLHDSHHDSLTSLPNRVLFLDRLEFLMARHRRHKKDLFVVLFLDIDRFKNVNDSLGHMTGDMLLKAISLRLKACVRPEDMVSRFGGDEFAILLDDVQDLKIAEKILERIQDELSAPFKLNHQNLYISASIGIAPGNKEYNRPEQVLRDADTAMYQAKAAGGACHEYFDKSMHTRVVARLQLESDLRLAIKNNELCVYYQPIIELETGNVAGIEALVRWKHPVQGLISPGEFIPVAEETGLIVPIGDWVLHQACHQLHMWHKKFPSEAHLSISVNISRRQFSPDLIDKVRHVLDRTGIEPENLKIEINESIIMEKEDSVAQLLFHLKDMKIRLQIDDFGTGYSSLSYLHHFPVDTLKIDRSFIQLIETDEEKLEIVRAISSLAQIMNMDIIAEGVETEGQLEQLRILGCKYVQGFLFSRPLDNRAIETFLMQSRILI